MSRAAGGAGRGWGWARGSGLTLRSPRRILIRFQPLEPWQVGRQGTVLTFL